MVVVSPSSPSSSSSCGRRHRHHCRRVAVVTVIIVVVWPSSPSSSSSCRRRHRHQRRRVAVVTVIIVVVSPSSPSSSSSGCCCKIVLVLIAAQQITNYSSFRTNHCHSCSILSPLHHRLCTLLTSISYSSIRQSNITVLFGANSEEINFGYDLEIQFRY